MTDSFDAVDFTGLEEEDLSDCEERSRTGMSLVGTGSASLRDSMGESEAILPRASFVRFKERCT
jgi:hypothetical protein